jgi:hypothetical protein
MDERAGYGGTSLNRPHKDAMRYSGTWWNRPLKDRVREALLRYRHAEKAMKEAQAKYETRVLIHETASTYKDLAKEDRESAAARYRWALFEYVVAKGEYERLLRLPKAEMAELVGSPSGAPGRSSPQTNRGPIGSKLLTREGLKRVEEETRERIGKVVVPKLRGRISLDSNDPDVVEMADELEKMVREAIAELKKEPNEKNLVRLLISTEPLMTGLTEAAGASKRTKAHDATRAAGAAVKQLHGQAATFFEQSPTFANFKMKSMLGKAAYMLGEMGADDSEQRVRTARGRRNKPAGSYTVAQGDSLPSIAKDFYGAAGFWDVIYLHNLGRIGQDPAKLRPGTLLDIP